MCLLLATQTFSVLALASPLVPAALFPTRPPGLVTLVWLTVILVLTRLLALLVQLELTSTQVVLLVILAMPVVTSALGLL